MVYVTISLIEGGGERNRDFRQLPPASSSPCSSTRKRSSRPLTARQ
jgi:hypothetical protein